MQGECVRGKTSCSPCTNPSFSWTRPLCCGGTIRRCRLTRAGQRHHYSSSIQQCLPLLLSFKLVMTEALKTIKLVVGDAEAEEVKYWLSDDRIFRFFLTQLISMVHIVLEYLAFRGDWRFFVGRKTFTGLSVSSLLSRYCANLLSFSTSSIAEGHRVAPVLISVGKDSLWSA